MTPMENQTLRAGIASDDITPPLGTRLFGYPDPVRLGQVVADRLRATVLLLDGAAHSAALVALDWCLVDEEETALIRTAVAAATGIDPADVTVCASHTHSAPETLACWGWSTRNQAYLDQARLSIASAARLAHGSMQPVTVGVATSHTEAGVNRREVTLDGRVILGFNEWGPRDDTVTVVRLEGAAGPLAQIVHLSAHPTSRGKDPDVSRDWPGVMMDRVESVTGAPTLFINGAFGDVAPRMAIRTSAGTGGRDAAEVGLRAADDVLRAWHGIRDFRPVPVETFHGIVTLPFAPLESRAEAQRQLRDLGPQADAAGELGCAWNYWNAVRLAHDQPARSARTFAQTLTRLGPVVIVPFAGEIFSEIALRLRKASPYEHTLCAGTSNGSHGYYVTREARARGGYEVFVGRAYGAYLLAENIDDVLVQENLALLSEMRRLELADLAAAPARGA